MTPTIRFGGQERIPVFHLNRDQQEGDLLAYHLSPGREQEQKKGALFSWCVNEWGYALEVAIYSTNATGNSSAAL